jgi:hypothetical protein
MPPTVADCLARVPDDDRCVDLRGVLLSGRCRLYGDAASGFVACSEAYAFAVAWGAPAADVVRTATDGSGWEDAEEWHLMAEGDTAAASLAARRRRAAPLAAGARVAAGEQ